MEHQVLVLQTEVNRQDDTYYYDLICQDFSNLAPIEQAADFQPGDISNLIYHIFVFKVRKNNQQDLPSLPRRADDNDQIIQFKLNGKALRKIYNGISITKRTFTAPSRPYSLWEYVIDSADNTWTILHHYALKKNAKLGVEQTQKQIENVVDNQLDQAYLTYNNQQPPLDHHSDINMIDFQPSAELNEPIFDVEAIAVDLEPAESMHDDIRVVIQDPHVVQELHVQPIDERALDDGLPNIPAYMYYKLLNESVAQRKFFNAPIHVYEELFKFKMYVNISDVDSETGEVIERVKPVPYNITELIHNSFEFITDDGFIHLVSPGGTGKTMAMFQLAKSFDRDGRDVIPVVCKAEYFWREIVIGSRSLIECLVNSSMVTADIRDPFVQHEWCESLTRVIQQGTGVILMIDAVDEMRTADREAFLHYLDSILPDIPGQVQDLNIAALVVSSRPGVVLPTADNSVMWTKLKMQKIRDSNHALKILCIDDASFERALALQQSFKFPQTLFWYSLIALEARSIDPRKQWASSQFDFLGGLLLQSIKVTQQKGVSLDDDQRELLNEDPTVLLQVAALMAYLAKVLGTTRVPEIEPYLSSLIITSNFPSSLHQASGTIIKKLLPVYQFCHYADWDMDSNTDGFIKFDHQIIWDYLTADFIVKTIVKRSYPSLFAQLDSYDTLKFDWQKCVESTASDYSDWTQPLHLVADALSVTRLITMMKNCDEQQAIDWISAVLTHPRTRDVTARSQAFVKLVVSCLYNASKKDISFTSHQKKKFKENEQQIRDDKLTWLCFDLAFKLFGQPINGQLFFDDINQYKPFSSFLTEIKLRNRDREFVDLIIRKFDSKENRVPDELISFVTHIHLHSDFDTQVLMEGLFHRMSSRCAEELIDHPMRQAIEDIFVNVFKEECCFDFLLAHLANTEDANIQASAMTIFHNFKTLSLDRVRRMIQMIKPSEEQQRVVYALPHKLPLEVFDDLLRLALECESVLWSEIMQAFERIFEDTQECYDRFCELFDYFKTYLIAKRTLTEAQVKLSAAQLERLAVIYQDPAAFYQHQHQLEQYEIKSIRTCISAVARQQELTEEQKGFFDLLPKPMPLPPRRFRVGQVYYEADTIENYVQSFCSGPINQESVTLLQRYYIPHYVKTAETALQLLEHVAEQFRTVVCPSIPAQLPGIDPRYRLFFDRSEPHLIATQTILEFLKKIKLDNTQLARLISWMNLAVNMRIGVRDEWYSLLDLRSCHQLFTTLSEGDQSIKWSVDNMVALWKVIGTVHYQDIASRTNLEFSSASIPIMLHNWTQEDIDSFLGVVADLEFGSKLQADIEKVITSLTSITK